MKILTVIFALTLSSQAFADCRVDITRLVQQKTSGIDSFKKALSDKGYLAVSSPNTALKVEANYSFADQMGGSKQILDLGLYRQQNRVTSQSYTVYDSPLRPSGEKQALKEFAAELPQCNEPFTVPKRIRCEGKSPYRRFSRDHIRGKALNRMYDVQFDSEAQTYQADLRIVVQSHCCGVPLEERPAVTGAFKINDHRISSVAYLSSNPVSFEIDLKERTCSFQFADGTKNFDGVLVSLDGDYLP